MAFKYGDIIEIHTSIDPESQSVMITFNQPVQRVGFTLERAKDFLETWKQQIRNLETGVYKEDIHIQ